MAINVNKLKNKIRNELRQAPTPTQGTRNTTGSTVQSQAQAQTRQSSNNRQQSSQRTMNPNTAQGRSNRAEIKSSVDEPKTNWDYINTVIDSALSHNSLTAPLMKTMKSAKEPKTVQEQAQPKDTRTVTEKVGDFITSIPKGINERKTNRSYQFGMSDEEQERIARERGASDEDIAQAKQAFAMNIDYINRNAQHGHTYEKMVENQMRTAGGLPMDSWLRFLPDDDGNIVDRSLNSARAGVLMHGQGLTGLQADIGNRLGAEDYEEDRLKDFQYQQALTQQALSGDNQGAYDRIFANSVSNLLTGLETTALGQLGGMSLNTHALENIGLGNMAVNAFGNAYGNVMTGGMGEQYANDVDAARRYAYASALNELGQEKLFDALSLISGGKITENTIPGANVFGLGSFITEAAEEGTGALVDPFTEAALEGNVFSPEYWNRVGEIYAEQGLAGTMQNVRDSAIEGGLGGVMGGVMSNPVQSARQIATDVRGYANARKLSSALKWARQHSDANGIINAGQPKYLNQQAPNLNLAGASAKDSREIEFEAKTGSPNFKDGSYDYEKVDDGSLPIEMRGLERTRKIQGHADSLDGADDMLRRAFDAYTEFYIGDPNNDADLPVRNAKLGEEFLHLRAMRVALGEGALMSTSPKVRKDAQDANAFVVWDSIERCGANGAMNDVDPKVVNKLIGISNRVGVPFEFLPDSYFVKPDGARVGGWFAPGRHDKNGLRTGVIQLPISSANDVEDFIDVFLHEVTHTTEGTPEYYKLAEALKEIDGTVSEDYLMDMAFDPPSLDDYAKANLGVVYDKKGHLHRVKDISLGWQDIDEDMSESEFTDTTTGEKVPMPYATIAVDPLHMHGNEHYANLVGNFVRNLVTDEKYGSLTDRKKATFKDILAELGGENVALRNPISFLRDAMKNVATLDLTKETKRKAEKRIKRLLEDAMDASIFAETMGTVYDPRGHGQLKVEVNRVMRKGGTPVSTIPGRFNKDGTPMLVRDAVHLIDKGEQVPYDGVHEYLVPRYKKDPHKGYSSSWADFANGDVLGNHAITPKDLGNYSYKQDLSKAGLTRADIEEFSNAVARVMNDDVDTPITKDVFDKVAKKNEKAKALGFETFKRMIDDYDGRYAEYAEESMNEESKEADLNRQFKEPGDYLAGHGMAPSDAERLGENLKKKGDYSKSNYDRGVKSLKKNRGFTEEQAKAFLDDFKNQYNERYSQGLEKAKKKADAKAQREQANAQKAERKKSEKAKDREAFNRLMAEDAREQRNAQKNKNQKLNYYFDSRGRLIDAATGKPVKNVKRTNLNEQSTSKQTDERKAYFTDSEIEQIDAALKGGAIDEHEKEIVERAKKLQKTEWSAEFYEKTNESFKNTVEEAYKKDDSITTESEDYKDFLQKMYDFASYEQYDSSGGFDIDVLRAISDWNWNHPNAQIDAGETDTGFYINDDSYTRETDVLDKIAEFANSKNPSETEQKTETPRKTDSQIYDETFNPTDNETTTEEKEIENTEERKTEENREEERKEETSKEETAEQPKVEYPLTEPSPTELAETLKSENSDDKFARILNEIDNPRAERTGNDEELNSVLAIAYYRLGASVEHANALADRKMSTGNSRTRYTPVMEDIMKEHPELTLKEAKALLANIHSRYNDMVKTAQSQRNKQGFTRQQAQNVETENVMDAETTVRQQAEEPTNKGTLEQAMVSEPQNVAENKTKEPTKQETKKTSEKVEATAENSESKTILDTVAQMRTENNSTKKIEEYYKSLGMDDATAKEVAEFTTDGVKMEREGAGNAETLKRAANQIAQKGEMTYEDAFKQLVDAKKNSWDKSREILKERETASKINTENKIKEDKVKQAKTVTDDIVKNLEKETGKKATKEQKQTAETVGETIAEQTAEDRQIEAGYWAEFDKAFDETLGSTDTSVRENIEKMNKMRFPNISKAHKEMANKYFKEKPVIHRADMTKNSKEWFDKVGLNGASAWAQWTLDKQLALPAIVFDKVNYARQQADTALRDFELQYQREIKPIKDAGYTVGRTSFLDGKNNKLQEVTVGGKTYKFEDIKGIKDATRELIGVAKPLEELYQTRKSDAARLLATPVEGALETPMSVATKIEKWVGRLNKQLEAEGKLKNGKIEINQDLLNDYIMETDEKQRHKIFEHMMTEIGEQLPKDAIDMFHQVRMTNMLFNGPTQARNIVSNGATGTMFLGSNVIATGMEKLLPKEQRTRAIVPGKDGIKFAKQYRLESGYVDDVAKDDRFNTQIAQRLSGAFPNSNVFGRLMNKKAKATAWMVEGGDKIFINPQADYYMATTLKARGYEIQQKDGRYIAVDKNGKEISKEAMDKVAEHAKSIAEQATFHDVNKFAEKLSNFQKNPNLFKSKTANKVFGEMFSVFQPYYKTPANVLRRAIEFSPQALIFNTVAGGVQVAQGKMDANTYINKLAKGTTGLGLAMIGGLLANMGVLVKGAPDDDDDEEEYYRENIFGVQPWSLHLGDSYYSLDWLLPFASPFLIGADFHETLKERGINPLDWTAEDYLKTFTSYNVILSASYLQNPVEMLSNAVNAGSSEFGEFDYVAAAREVGETYIENAVNQVLPADWAGWNRVIDPVKRTQAGNNLYERVRNSIYAKVPFLSTNLEPAVDQKGQVIGNTGENVLERVYHYKIAPYKKTTDTHDLYDEILMENKAAPKTQWQLKGALKGSLGDHHMDWAKDFSPKDYTAAKKTYYGTYNQYTKDLADLDEYEGLGQTAKDSVYGKLDSLAMANAKAEYFKKVNDDTLAVEKDIYSKEQRVALEAERLYGISPAEFFTIKQHGLSGNREALYMMSVYDNWKDPNDPSKSYLDYLREEASEDGYLTYSAVGISKSMFKKTPDELAELEYYYLAKDGGTSIYQQAEEYRGASTKKAQEAVTKKYKDIRDGETADGNTTKGTGSKGKGSKRKSSGSGKRSSSRKSSGSSSSSSSSSSFSTDEMEMYMNFFKDAGKALKSKGNLPSAKVNVDFEDDSALWERLMNSNKSSVEKLRRELGIK